VICFVRLTGEIMHVVAVRHSVSFCFYLYVGCAEGRYCVTGVGISGVIPPW
jgi:hypothetical protein